jgi:cytochrome oxidase assembly protein ShyY1
MRSLQATALITFIALKLAGVVAWSWWWVLSPLWINAVPLVLVAGGLLVLWCLGHWPFTLVNRFRWRRRRQARVFFRFEPPPVSAHPRQDS